MLTEEEAARYWRTMHTFRTLSDSDSQKTIEERTAEFGEAKAMVLECMNTSASDMHPRQNELPVAPVPTRTHSAHVGDTRR